MTKYIIRRLLFSTFVLFAILMVTFGLTHALPGGPFDSSNKRRLPDHIRFQLEQKFGLNKPVFFNLPGDGKGSETAWGKTLSVKGNPDAGYQTHVFEAPEGAGVHLYGEYKLIDNGEPTCLRQKIQPGWALVSRREECIIKGGDRSQTFTEVNRHYNIDLLDAQFWVYLSNVIGLDFGPSLNLALVQDENKQVIDLIKERVPVSLQLGIYATLLGFAVGIPLGALSAVYHNSFLDYGGLFLPVLGQSIPVIVLAPILRSIFAVKLRWLPVADRPIWVDGTKIIFPYVLTAFGGVVMAVALMYLISILASRQRSAFLRVQSGAVALAVLLLAGWLIAHEQKTLAGFSTFQTVFSDYVRAVILPVATIGIGMSAGIARMTRASLLEVLGNEYIQTARAKGLHERTVIFVHALKNALIPVATGLGSLLVGLVSGSFVIEKIFSIPGMGDIFIVAVGARDYTTIMGVTIFYSFLLIIGYLLVDILYTWLDPRIRFD